MTYICEKCGDELDDDTDGVLLIKIKNEDATAYCLLKVTCVEAGAEVSTIFARREAALIKRAAADE